MEMNNTNHYDNNEIPPMNYTSPYEDYIRGNYARSSVSTQNQTIDLKGPDCYTGSKRTDDIVQNFLSPQKQQLDRLAQTVNERGTKEEGIFVGRHFDD